MAGCGCGSSSNYTPNPGNGIDALSNAMGYSTWNDPLTESLSPQGISGRSPYGFVPTFGGISFCKKCFLTWALVFVAVAFFFFRKK